MRYRIPALLLIMLLLTSAVTAQTIQPLAAGDQVLVNLPDASTVTAFTFDNPAEANFALDVVYLGAPFDLRADWYAESGSLLATLVITEAGTGLAANLPAEALTLVLSVEAGEGGRAVLTLLPADTGQTPLPVETTPDDLFPRSGTWILNLVDYDNSCPDDLFMEDVWMPREDANYVLTFSPADNLPLQIHALVAAQEISETPEFFTLVPEDDPFNFSVIPNIQTQPYTYHYTVTSAESIQLEYVQTLALSDCVLRINYELLWFSPSLTLPDNTGQATDFGDMADLSLWTGFGDVTDLEFVTDIPDAPTGALCGTDQGQGETWYFQADETFLDQVRAGYGLVLSYDLLAQGSANFYENVDLELVVGNGIILHYNFDYFPGEDWTNFTADLREGAGWYDPDGFMSTDDADLFRQMLSDVTALLIRGEYIEGSDFACLTNVQMLLGE